MTTWSIFWRDRMKLQNNLIFLSFILFISCSKVNIENENKTMMQGLKEKEISTENLKKKKREC